MKKHLNLWLAMFLAISLALPVYSMAADMNLRLMTQDGYSLTTNTPTISSFAVDNDNTLVLILKEPPILDFGDPYPEITIDTPSSCTKINNAHVKGNPGTTFSFNVRTTTAGATLSSTSDTTHPSIVPDYYGASFVASRNTGTFSWNTAGNGSTVPSTPAGRYLAVFSATPSTCPLPSPSTCTSQLVVMINIALQYKLTLTAGANGSVSPAEVNYYDPATQVQISATANQGYYFSGWSGDAQGTTNPLTITMNSDKTITANFTQTPAQYTLTTSVSPANAGTVSPSSGNYDPNTNVDLTATAASGYTFSSWSGLASGDTSSGNTARIYMNNNRSITANFTQTPTQYTLTTSVSPANAGTVSPSSGNYNANANVDLTATAASGYTFSSWSGLASGDTSSGNTARIYMNNNRSITANFVQSATPSGETWVWDTYPTFYLNEGEEKVFIVNINRQLTYLRLAIAGLTETTMATFSWTFPDGRVFPQALNQGVVDIQGMNFGGLLVLRSGMNGWPNMSDAYIPQGNHILRIQGRANSSYFKAMLDVY